MIWWIQCSASVCSRHFHISCIGLTPETMPGRYKRWYCPLCSEVRKKNKKSTNTSLHSPKYTKIQPDDLNDKVETVEDAEFGSMISRRKLQEVEVADVTVPEIETEVQVKSSSRLLRVYKLILILIFILITYFFVFKC